MNRNNSLPIVAAGAVLICLAAIFPTVFASIVGIGIILAVAAIVLGGFVFLVQHWETPWPVGILVGVLLLGLLWPPALGLVVGAGIVGGVLMLVYAALKESGR